MDISTSAPGNFVATATRPGSIEVISRAVRELWSRRRLVRYLVQADLKKKGADTLLGNVWWVLDPLLQMIVYVVLVSIIFARPQPDYPLFIFAAILPWKWFTSAIGDSITSVSGQDRLIKQVQFPKIVLPTAATVAGIASFAFGIIPLLLLLALLYTHRLSGYLLLIPAIAAVQFVFTLGIAYVLSAINVFYRDVGNLSRHVLRLWFYLSPALYGPEALERLGSHEATIGQLLRLNPFFTLFESYRAVIYGTATGGPRMPDWAALAVVLLASLVLLALATIFFKRLEPSFAKVL